MAKKRIHDFESIIPSGNELILVDEPDGSGGYIVKTVLVSALSTFIGGGGGGGATTSDNVSNESTVTGLTVTEALDELLTDLVNHVHTVADITDFDSAVQSYIDGLVDSAPGALDTLNELAAALGDDPNFATTVTNAIAQKISLTEKGAINGVAELNANGVVPADQLDIAYENTYTVSKGGLGQYSTVKAAVDAANASGQISTVLIYPGTYIEDPIVVTGPITVKAVGEATIQANDPNSDLFTLSTGSLLRKITFAGPTNAASVKPAVGAFNPVVENCVFQSGLYGAICEDATSSIVVADSRFSPGITGNSLRVEAGTIATPGCFDISGVGMYVENGTLSITALRISGASVGLFADNGGKVICQGFKLDNCNVGIRTGIINPSLTELFITSLEFSGTSTYDIDQQGASKITAGGGIIRQARLNLASPETFSSYYLDNSPEEEAFEVMEPLNVGTLEKPCESSFGRGSNYSRGMIVLTTDTTTTSTTDGGNFINVTDEASSESGSTFAFQSGVAGASILFCSQRLIEGVKAKTWGMDYTVTTPLNPTNWQNLEFEYWNGASWAPFSIMAHDPNNSYVYSEKCFIRSNKKESINFGLTEENPWALKTISGFEGYWFRIRIASNLANAGCSIEKVKLHTSHMSINERGNVLFYGLGRFTTALVSSGNIFGESGSVTDFSENIGAGVDGQSWTHTFKNSELNATNDAIYFEQVLPTGVDTSLPVYVHFYYNSNGAVGDADIMCSLIGIESEGVIFAPNADSEPRARTLSETLRKSNAVGQPITITRNITGSNQLQRMTFGPFSISELFPEDMIWVRLKYVTANGTIVGVSAAYLTNAMNSNGQRL